VDVHVGHPVEKQHRNTSNTGPVLILDPATVEGAVVVQATSTHIKLATVNNVKVSVFEHILVCIYNWLVTSSFKRCHGEISILC
jgi:hypothetical protein